MKEHHAVFAQKAGRLAQVGYVVIYRFSQLDVMHDLQQYERAVSLKNLDGYKSAIRFEIDTRSVDIVKGMSSRQHKNA